MNRFKSAVRIGLNRLGYEIIRIPKSESGSSLADYEPVYPLATYSPWNQDARFVEWFARVQASTLVDRYRCYELWKLVEQAAKLPGGGCLEVGVWRGGTGALIAAQALACGISEPVVLCDTFSGVVKAGEKDSLYTGGEHADTSRARVQTWLVDELKLSNVEILEGVFPDDTAASIENQRFRFCHIDVDVYQSAHDVTQWVWPRLVVGGIVVYDDYGFFGCEGVAHCVNEQLGLADRLVIHNLNGHAVIVKRW